MHTVIRHLTTEQGFVLVVTGRASDPIGAVLQTYHSNPANGTTALVHESKWTDERDAIAMFDMMIKPRELPLV